MVPNNFKTVEFIIDDWLEKGNNLFKISEVDRIKFENWAGSSFRSFIKEVHPKQIQKKLKGIVSEVDLFNEKIIASNFPKLQVDIVTWTVADDNLEIAYNFQQTHFGEVLIASTVKGICWLAFVDEKEQSLTELKTFFSKAEFKEQDNQQQQELIRSIFNPQIEFINPVSLHLKGSDFQLKVWNALTGITVGEVKMYKDIADMVSLKNGSRAVGTAIGKNPIAYIIPCHRVVRGNGVIGNFRWGSARKIAFLAWEALLLNS